MAKKQPHKYLPFGHKLLLSYCLFIIIPILLVGYVANSIFVGSVRDQTRSNIQGTLRQMKDNVTYKMEDILRISNLLYYDKTLGSHLRRSLGEWNSYLSTKDYLLPKYDTTIESSNNKMWLSVYIHNKSLPEIYNVYTNSDPISRGNHLFDIYYIDRIQDKPWYRKHPAETYGKTLQWKQIEDDVQFGRLSLLRRIVDTENPVRLNELAFVRISVQLSELFESLDYRKIGNGSTVFVVDQDNRIYRLSGDKDQIAGEVWDGKTTDNQLLIEERIAGLDWKLIALIPADITDQDTSKVRLATIAIFLVCFVVFFFASLSITRYFARRVSKIILVLDSFQEGNFHKRVQFKGRDEFTRIASALNEMGEKTGDLIQEVYLTNIQKNEAELESLQAQINPHFLSNTLSSINQMAKFGEIDKLQRMVMDLAKFYRLTLNEGKTIISIFKELEQVKAYIDIQKTKYEERMSVQYDIDPEILKFDTVKLILQPFIENVLEHAWCGDRIHIRVLGFREQDRIVFTVIDDGVGMRPSVIGQILDPLEGSQIGYGIRNVDQRIKLHFGKQYGVHIYSKLGIGTTVRITIPVRRQMRNKASVNGERNTDLQP